MLPCELPLDHLRAVTGWQATANRMPACLVLGSERCLYFEPDGRERASGAIPHGGVQVANLLLPCYPLPANPETMERVERLEKWVQANKPSGGYLFGDLTKGGRRATPEEVLLLSGCNGNGVPQGLARCATCGDWRGECLDPSPQFAGLMMQVHRRQNDTLCARCAKPLYDRKLNANVFHEGAVWHVPGSVRSGIGALMERTGPCSEMTPIVSGWAGTPSGSRFCAPCRPNGTLGTMNRTRGLRRKAGFLKHHALSLAAIGILLLWVALYVYADPKTHRGSFFGNAIADWTGVVVTVIATKYFYEIGSAESRQPGRRFRNRLLEIVRDHSLTIFLVLTGAGWILLYLKMDSEGKWGQVIGNIVSEWTQLLGLVLMTKRLIEDKSKESR